MWHAIKKTDPSFCDFSVFPVTFVVTDPTDIMYTKLLKNFDCDL